MWDKFLELIRDHAQFIVALFILIITSLPDSIMLINKSSRRWLKEGIEGENKKLDPYEIREMILYWGMLACVRLFSFVIVMSVILDKRYDYYVYLLPFAGMVGAGGALVKTDIKK